MEYQGGFFPESHPLETGLAYSLMWCPNIYHIFAAWEKLEMKHELSLKLLRRDVQRGWLNHGFRFAI